LKESDGNVLTSIKTNEVGSDMLAADLLGMMLSQRQLDRPDIEFIRAHRYFGRTRDHQIAIRRLSDQEPLQRISHVRSIYQQVKHYSDCFCWVKELGQRCDIQSLVASEETIFLCMALYRHLLCSPELSVMITSATAQTYLSACFMLAGMFNGQLLGDANKYLSEYSNGSFSVDELNRVSAELMKKTASKLMCPTVLTQLVLSCPDIMARHPDATEILAMVEMVSMSNSYLEKPFSVVDITLAILGERTTKFVSEKLVRDIIITIGDMFVCWRRTQPEHLHSKKVLMFTRNPSFMDKYIYSLN
jgi:hypothetical protein